MPNDLRVGSVVSNHLNSHFSYDYYTQCLLTLFRFTGMYNTFLYLNENEDNIHKHNLWKDILSMKYN